MKNHTVNATRLLLITVIGLLVMPSAVDAGDLKLSRGQTLYVPVYSHVYIGDREMPFLLATTLSIRNTDPEHPIRLETADYYDSSGQRLKRYVTSARMLNPLATERFVIKESDKTGGSGAKLIVTWRSDEPVAPAIVEAVMISTRSNQGISFVTRGQVIREAD